MDSNRLDTKRQTASDARPDTAAGKSHRYDKDEVKAAARGRWAELLNRFANIPADYLDGRHRGCPLCGQGKDCFRSLDDFTETGAVYCNKCHDTKNGDGFAAITKVTGKLFPEVLGDVAEYLGVRPRPSKNGDASRNGQNGSKSEKKRRDPLAAVDWYDERVARKISHRVDNWCKKKPPITRRAADDFGGRQCRWPKTEGTPCIGFVGRDLDGAAKAVLLYRVDGQPFPATKNLSERKTHLVAGSAESWLFPGGEFPIAAAIVHKCEGLPDALTLTSVGLPDGHVAITNACGARSCRKLDYSWVKGKGIVIAADADQPGVEGGKLHAAKAHQAGAAWVKLITPPGYEIADDGGKDFRDWFAEGHTMDEYLALVEATPTVSAEEAKDWGATRKSERKNDGAITNAIAIPGEDGKDVLVPLTMTEILARINAATGGWPRRFGKMLFVHDGESADVHVLDDAAGLFGWLQSATGIVEWQRVRGSAGKPEVFAEAARTAKEYRSIEKLPHEPRIDGHYYTCEFPEPGDGSALEMLLDFFETETPLDRQMLRAAFATPLWGGPPGGRPAFMITAMAGRGRGKSRLAQLIGRLYLEHIDVSSQDDIGKIKTILLSPSAWPLRVAVLDNIKTNKFSWGELEALLTSNIISGHMMYEGHASRPNLLTWILTLNGASLSTDMAQRIVEIRLASPKYRGDWEEKVTGHIDGSRQAILADLVGFLRRPKQSMTKLSRWATWESEVLSRIESPDEALDLILERRGKVDVEQEETEIIRDYFASRLRSLEYDTDREDIFIPNDVAANWYNAATKEGKKTTGVTRTLNQYHDEGKLHEIKPHRIPGSGARGFRWIGEHVLASDPTFYDLERRLFEKAQKSGF